MEALEVGYSKHKNPYHNLMHAADVTQTVHFLLLKTGMMVRSGGAEDGRKDRSYFYCGISTAVALLL